MADRGKFIRGWGRGCVCVLFMLIMLIGGLISDHASDGGVLQIHFSVIIFYISNHEGIYT